jgi:ribosomal protein S25
MKPTHPMERENKEQKERTHNWAKKQKPSTRGEKKKWEKVMYLTPLSQETCQKGKKEVYKKEHLT